MAKQTFTTGDVLTATAMNNLQANDYNWTVSQKAASYVLVATDKGTRIEMNAAGATTITVNTGLFTAGDTLFIQNIGAGATTITAGTATVNKATAGSLTLAQFQGGTLYFVSASSAVFFADAGYSPPLTTKGDLFGYDTAAARIPIGSNNQVLTADSAQALGLKWAAVPTGGMTLLETISMTGASSYTSASISSGYVYLYVQIKDFYSDVDGGGLQVRPNSTSSSVYSANLYSLSSAAGSFTSGSSLKCCSGTDNGGATDMLNTFVIYGYSNTDTYKTLDFSSFGNNQTNPTTTFTWEKSWGLFASNTAITTLNFFSASGAVNLYGSIAIYGVK